MYHLYYYIENKWRQRFSLGVNSDLVELEIKEFIYKGYDLGDLIVINKYTYEVVNIKKQPDGKYSLNLG